MNTLFPRTLRRRRARRCCCSRSRFSRRTFSQPQPLLSLLTREAPTLVARYRHGAGHHLPADRHFGRLAFAVCAVVAGLLAAAKLPLAVVFAGVDRRGRGDGRAQWRARRGARLPCIVVTLATMVTWREACGSGSKGGCSICPTGVQWFGLSQPAGQTTAHRLRRRAGRCRRLGR